MPLGYVCESDNLKDHLYAVVLCLLKPSLHLKGFIDRLYTYPTVDTLCVVTRLLSVHCLDIKLPADCRYEL